MSGNCYPGHLFLITRRMLHRMTLRLPNKRGQMRARPSELGCRLNRGETTVKNGPDALEMGYLFMLRLAASSSATVERSSPTIVARWFVLKAGLFAPENKNLAAGRP